MTAVAAPAGWHEAWTSALDAVELDVDRAEQLLAAVRSGQVVEAGPATTWTPPRLPGLLPTELLERATALLQRQLDVAEALARATTMARRQVDLVNRAHPAQATAARPMYIDTAL